MELLTAAAGDIELPHEVSPPEPPRSRQINTKAALLAFTILYLAGSLAWAARKTMGFDELFTYKIAQLRSIREIWNVIHAGIECNPPFSFVVAHWSQQLFGVNALATRLPAIAGYWIMSVCLFVFVRRRTDALHGLIAMLIPFFTIANFYITEARPYGMVLGATAAALLCWQSAADSRYRSVAIPALAVLSAVLGGLHYYAVYVPLAILCGEAVRSFKARRLDWPVLAALLLGLGSVVLWLPLISAARASSSHFWGAAGFRQLPAVFRDFTSPLWFAIPAVGFLLARDRQSTPESSGRPCFPLHEAVVCFLLISMPVVMFLAAILVTNAYSTRYVLPAVVALPIVATFWLYRVRHIAPQLARFAVTLLVVCFIGAELLNLLALAMVSDPRTASRAMYPFPADPPLPIAIGSDDAFLRVRHYGDAALAARCYYLTDLKAAADFFGVDTGERSLAEWSKFQPDNIVDYQKFIHENPDFYAIRVSQHAWLIQKLAADGAQITLVSSKKELTFEAEEQMYFRVHIPGRAATVTER
jgi:hypothetical protein